MTELIERLEKATGPDRELDGAIFWAAKRANALRAFFNGSMGMPQHPAPAELPEHGLGRHAVVHSSPRYTASIDAAMTLVPTTAPDWEVKTASHRKGYVALLFDPKVTFRADAQSPAIALCIAALKARQSVNAPVTT